MLSGQTPTHSIAPSLNINEEMFRRITELEAAAINRKLSSLSNH